MKNTKTSRLKFAYWDRPLILAGLIVLLGGTTPSQLHAGWVWPWQGNDLQAQVQQARRAENVSQQRAESAERQVSKAVRHARLVVRFSLLAGLLGAGIIGSLRKKRTVVKQVVNNEIVQQVVREEVIVRSPAHELVPDTVVIDGKNVIYGSPSDQKPALLNLLGLLPELQKRNCAFKCFFDANTFYTLNEAGRKNEAYAYRRLCHDFPDMFIEVAGGNRADDYILDYAHSHGTPIISNDRYRDYEEKYGWLKTEINRRVSFVVHSGMIQIVPLGIQADIPQDLNAADSLLRSGFIKTSPVEALVESKHCENTADDNAHTNGEMVLAAA